MFMYVYIYIYTCVCMYVAVWIHIYTICMGMNIHLPTILIWMNRRGAQCNLKKPLVPGSTSTSSFVSMFHIRPLCSLCFLGVGSLGTTFCKGVSLCSGFNLCRECRGVSHWTFFFKSIFVCQRVTYEKKLVEYPDPYLVALHRFTTFCNLSKCLLGFIPIFGAHVYEWKYWF